MKTRTTSNNRMLIITEARKQLKEIETKSQTIPRFHSLIFTHCLVTPMPVIVPNQLPLHERAHIHFGTHTLKREHIKRILDDEEQLYYMTS